MCNFVEYVRFEDFRNPGSQASGQILGITDDFKGVANGYPGGRVGLHVESQNHWRYAFRRYLMLSSHVLLTFSLAVQLYRNHNCFLSITG